MSYSKEIEHAEFEVLQDVNASLNPLIASLTDWFLAGQKGKAFTEVIANKGLSSNPDELRSYYESNKSTLEGYFDLIDTRKTVDLINPSVKLTKTVRDVVYRPEVLIPIVFVAGLATMYLIKKEK